MGTSKLERLNYRLLLGCILVGLLAIFITEVTTTVLLKNSIQTQDKIAKSINDTGRQRMLIRQIALLSSRYAYGEKAIEEKLQKTVEQYLSAHHILSSKQNLSYMPNQYAKNLQSLYFKQKNNLSSFVMAYANKTYSLVKKKPKSSESFSTNNEIYKMSQGTMFSLTNQVVDINQQALVYTKQKANDIMLYSFWFVTFVIISEFIFIFVPIIRKVKQSYDKVIDLALTDNLTNLGNRNLLIEKAENAITQAKLHNSHVAIFYIDLDNFKDINDAYGLLIGDILLNEVANRLRSSSREKDILVRLGGDEFALLLDDVDNSTSISVLADRHLKAFERPFQVEGKTIKISLSLGISVFPHSAKTVDGLMTHADTALYKAKALGKNSYAFYTEALHSESQRRIQIDLALHNAIQKEEFELYYQPQIDVNLGCVVGVEALIRWNNKELGNPSPEEFIPIAESGNHIFSIGFWVLMRAVDDLKLIFNVCGNSNFKLSINLSAREVLNDSFLKEKLQLLKEYKDVTKNLVFELTETSLIRDYHHAERALNELNDCGIKIALDDFGTGYSSLKHLKRLPISTIKIDKSFVQDIGIDSNDMKIIKAITQLAGALNFDMVAEGVETEDQLDFILKNNCSVIQGYLFAKPMKLNDLIKYIQENHHKTSLKKWQKSRAINIDTGTQHTDHS